MASTLTEITDSVKKESKTSVFDSFLYVFWHFEDFSKVKICKLTMPFSLLIFGVFLKNQGLNLQHTDFSHFLREVCPIF